MTQPPSNMDTKSEKIKAQKAKLTERIEKYKKKLAQLNWDLRQPVNRGNLYSRMFNKARDLEWKIDEIEDKIINLN